MMPLILLFNNNIISYNTSVFNYVKQAVLILNKNNYNNFIFMYIYVSLLVVITAF